MSTLAPYTYDHVPTLKELLPSNGGLPGVEYMQVCDLNGKEAQDQGWGPVRDAKMFTIEGPKGSANIILACKGEPIAGASTQEGARMMYLDENIYGLTGKWLGMLPESLQETFDVNEYGEGKNSAGVTVPRKTVAERPADSHVNEPAKSKKQSLTEKLAEAE